MTRARVTLIGLIVAVFLLALASFAVGPANLPLAGLLHGLFGGDDWVALVAREIRLPRVLLGLGIGAVLGLSGAALQGLLRNPLAEPALVGVSGLAGLGAVLVLYFGVGYGWPLAVPLAGIGGAALAVALLYGLAGREGGTATLILAGVAINSLAAAGTALALNFAASAFAAVEITFWLLGSLTDRSLIHVALALPFMAVGAGLLLSCGRGLDTLALGEDTARSLGTNLRSLRFRAIAGTGLAVGAAVAVCGAIGFVGLVVPHLLRPLFGHEPGRLLVPSALGGAALVLGADIVVRIVPTDQELKLGVVTALIGAPFFLGLLWRLRRELA